MKKISFSGAMLVALVMSLLGATPAAAGWAPRVVDTSTTFLGIAFTADGQKGLAVGTGGVFAMTFDGGKTWGPVALPAYPNDLQDVVYLPGTTTAVVVGNNGTILKFTLNADQSGYSISNLSIKTAEIFNSVAFGDTQSGWVVSNGGVIYHTANGGQAWVDAMSPDAQPVKRVRAINAARALGSELTARRSGVFDPTTFVSRGLYLEDLYRQIPVAADEAVDRWFQDSLRMQNRLTRDGFLFVATEQRQKVTT